MTYGGNLQKSHTGLISMMRKVLILIGMRRNRKSFHGSRITTQISCIFAKSNNQ